MPHKNIGNSFARVRRMDRQTFLKWLRINGLCFIGAFIVVFFLVQLFPHTMLGFLGRWASLIELTGAKKATELPSDFDLFIHILSRNTMSIFITFLIGLLLQAPLLMIVYGSFYSLIAFLAPLTIGHPFALSDWILIAAEALSVIASATFASTLATEIFGTEPEKERLLDYWKKNWRRLLPRQERGWRIVFRESKKEFILFIIAILALLLFVAWFEVWGY